MVFFDSFTLWPWLFKRLFLKVDNCTPWLWSFLTNFSYEHEIWNRLTNLPLFLIFNLTIFTHGHALHLSEATNLWKSFSVKVVSKQSLTIFHPGCDQFFLFDNFTPWLSTFFDNFIMWLSHKKSNKFWLTILLLFVVKLVDNFTFWQKYYNPCKSLLRSMIVTFSDIVWERKR